MNYYNDNDRRACAWLRELIKEGLIPDGVVDERDIREIRPSELRGFVQCHFFAGVGGWAYALWLADWPESLPVWTGSCPCQPFSAAGKGGGVDDDRHLWPAFRWLVAQCRPSVVFGEQVASAAGRDWLSGVRLDLEGMGYGVGAADLCAAGVGAPHIRQRLWWVAGAECRGRESGAVDGESAKQFRTNSHVVGMADARRERRRTGGGNHREHDGAEFGTDGGLAQPHSRGFMGDEKQYGETEQGSAYRYPWGQYAGGCCGDFGLGDTKGEGPQGVWGEQGEAGEGRVGQSGLPSEVFIRCADGKTRRIKSGLSPLVDGFPGRVGLLRGYGNAIVPQTAAEFIRAYKDVAKT